MPLGRAPYLPEDWCDDGQRRRRAKIPDEVVLETKPELGVELIERCPWLGCSEGAGCSAVRHTTSNGETTRVAMLQLVSSVAQSAAKM